MRKLSAILVAGILAATPVLTTAAQAQTVNQYQGSQDGWNWGFYAVGGIALIGVALGILDLTENNNDHHHHHHHQPPVSP